MRNVALRSLATLAVTASLFATGCGKSPEAVCKKFDDIMKDDKEFSKNRDEDKVKKQTEECTKELGEIKEVSPEGYKCIVGCTEYKTAGGALGCLTDCQSKDDKLKEHQKKKREKEKEDRAKKIVEWTKLADKNFDSSVKDYKKNEIKFSITLAEGFTSKDVGDSIKSFEIEDKETFNTVHLSVMLDAFPDDADKAAEQAKTSKKTVVKKEAKDGGYVLQLEGENDLSVEANIKSGETNLKCTANIYNSDAKQFSSDLLPWLAKLCSSIKIK